MIHAILLALGLVSAEPPPELPGLPKVTNICFSEPRVCTFFGQAAPEFNEPAPVALRPAQFTGMITAHPARTLTCVPVDDPAQPPDTWECVTMPNPCAGISITAAAKDLLPGTPITCPDATVRPHG